MKQSILKFLAFLEPEWMRNFMHALIGYSLGYYGAIVTDITTFKSPIDVIIGGLCLAIFVGVFAGFYEYLQNVIFKALFSWQDIFIAMSLAFLGSGIASFVYCDYTLAFTQIIAGFVLFALDVIRLAIQKLMK